MNFMKALKTKYQDQNQLDQKLVQIKEGLRKS